MKVKHCFVIILFSLLLVYACKKEQIAPSNQRDAFVKYFGHIRDQKASDIKRTSDGGYLLLGSSNSFSVSNEDDFYLIKTDSLGNEQWSKTFGDGQGGFDEEGVAILVLPNEEGYIIAGNRTKMIVVAGQSRSDGTNIVLYKLDLDGNTIWEKILRPNTASSVKSDFVKDIKPTREGGFVLIGQTSKVNIGKNEYTLYAAYDKQDILILKLDALGNTIWESTRGFVGLDYGSSVELVDNDFVITGSSEIRVGGSPSTPIFLKQILVAKLRGTTGNEIFYENFGDANMYVEAAYSCYDSINGVISIIAHVEDLPNIIDPREGDLMILKINENISEINRKFYGKTSGGIVGISQNLKAASVLLAPVELQGSEPPLIITATHNVGNGGSECVMLKLNSDLSLSWDAKARLFGLPGQAGNWLPGNEAHRLIAVEELVPGTTRKELNGFAFTATLNLGTNNMIALIKTNILGTLTPQ
jgi:hypothetical protein